jgi:hypothetical protein
MVIRARSDCPRHKWDSQCTGFPERRVDLPAQVAGIDLDDVRVPVVVRVPHVMQDVGLGNSLALAPHEELQQGEFAGGELDRLPVTGDRVR